MCQLGSDSCGPSVRLGGEARPPSRSRHPILWLWVICAFSTGLSQGSEHDLDVWIGQMLMVGFRGVQLDPHHPFAREVKELDLGGVILFDYDVALASPLRNIRSIAQVRALSESLQSVARIPIFIAVDQEGGQIARFKRKHGAFTTPSQAELGRKDQEDLTRQAARQNGTQLSQAGVNLNLAPVADLALNPDNPIIARFERSYGVDPELVWRHSRWTIEEFHGAGILAAVKHFPGHGSSWEDSHRGLPDVTNRWTREELEPFQRLIAEGLPDMVMTAHLYNAHWDPLYPATLSTAVIQTLLREQLGFQGVVISDDLQMAAITEHYSLEQAIEQAVRAGVDMLLFANNVQYDADVASRAAGILRRLVETGRLSQERIERSYQRIRKLKLKLRKTSINNLK